MLDESEDVLWDFRVSRTLSVFGNAGSGKTVLARHIVKTWIRYGGTVLVGTRFPLSPANSDYGDLLDLIHLDTVENVIGYARTLESVRHGSNMLIVVDDWTHVSEEDAAYLDTPTSIIPASNVSWVVIRQRPRSHQFFDNIGMGQMNHATSVLGFGHDNEIEDPHSIERGVATQLARTGGTVQMRVPRSAQNPMENSNFYVRQPLPSLPKRLWYAA